MNFGDKIKAMLQEAELYRSQGLLHEAMERYRAVEALIKDNQKVKNSEAFLSKISLKINSLTQELNKIEAPKTPPKVTEKAQKLMKEMFSFDDPATKGSASLGGAIALAGFGQYEKAIEEFTRLFEFDHLRLDAAKNILKYGSEQTSVKDMIPTYQQWLSNDMFSEEEIDEIRTFFQDLLDKAGVKEDLSKLQAKPPVEPESEVDDDDILDISAIRFKLRKGPQKGDKVELDVNYQHGKFINLIISKKEKGLVESINSGDLIDGVIFYSPVAIFSGTGYVSVKKEISAGPKRGDFSLDIKIIRIET